MVLELVNYGIREVYRIFTNGREYRFKLVKVEIKMGVIC